jgi:hypothetical protein
VGGLRGRRGGGGVKQWKEHQGCCFHTNQAIGPQKSDRVAIKVNKNDNFFSFDFEFCTISLLVMHDTKIFGKNSFDWTIMGKATIIPRSLKNSD